MSLLPPPTLIVANSRESGTNRSHTLTVRGDTVVVTGITFVSSHPDYMFAPGWFTLLIASSRVVYYGQTVAIVLAGPDICSGLPGMHAFGSCDSTSQFAGYGKMRTMKLLLKDANFCAAMNLLGKEFCPTPETQQKVVISICTMYNSPECTNTNEVRNKKLNRLIKDITKLPPSHDSAVLHIQRVNDQAAIWRRCLEAEMITPSPEGTISIVWMTQDRAPEGVLHVMKCSCKANQPCSTRRCSCKRRVMICTQLCLCSDECWNN